MRSSFFNTIAFRLTLWFSGIFTICAGVVFILFYYLSVQTIQNQVDQELVDSASKFTAVIRRQGLSGARQLAVMEAQAAGEKLIFFRLVYPTGEVFASSHMAYWKQVHVNAELLESLIRNKGRVFETYQIPRTGQKVRILYSFVAANAILQTGVAMDSYAKFLFAFKRIFIGAMGFIILLSAVSGWLLVRKALSGVKTITATARNIGSGNLEDRVKGSGNKDELDHLARTFNRMLDRIEALVKSIREMSDNIAHDLKSPVTRIRGFAELSLVHEENLENYRTMAANTIEESDRLLDMINTMLVISRAESGEAHFEFKLTNLSHMIQEACDLFSPLAEDKQVRFDVSTEENLIVRADVQMLQRAFSNLIDNAIKYTPENGRIGVSAVSNEAHIEIRVEDTGCGIGPEHIDKIFDRFYRAESSRSSSGTGLGLSLARTIVRQHKGDVFVKSRIGEGSIFTLRLPIDNF